MSIKPLKPSKLKKKNRKFEESQLQKQLPSRPQFNPLPKSLVTPQEPPPKRPS